MAEFKAYDSGIEVSGEVVAAFIAGFPNGNAKIGFEILNRNGIDNPRPKNWYALQPFLTAMKEISEKLGGHMLTRIGEEISINAVLPPDLNSLEKCLQSIDIAYHMNHRGGEIGHYNYHYEGSFNGGLHRVRMTCPNCYSCAFDLGVLEGFSRRFKPEGAHGVVVRHDDSQPCRRKGDNSCSYLISWA